jgi:hypothetical protein
MLAESGLPLRWPTTWATAREGRGAREGAQRMSILVDQATRVVVQGITGKEGAFHAARARNTARRSSAA